MKILIIGGGNMGLTFAKSFIRAKSKPEDLMILEKDNKDRIRKLENLAVYQM